MNKGAAYLNEALVDPVTSHSYSPVNTAFGKAFDKHLFDYYSSVSSSFHVLRYMFFMSFQPANKLRAEVNCDPVTALSLKDSFLHSASIELWLDIPGSPGATLLRKVGSIFFYVYFCIITSFLEAYPWASLPAGSVLCDLGGGKGHVTKRILGEYPHLRAVIQDLGPVIEDAKQVSTCRFRF